MQPFLLEAPEKQSRKQLLTCFSHPHVYQLPSGNHRAQGEAWQLCCAHFNEAISFASLSNDLPKYHIKPLVEWPHETTRSEERYLSIMLEDSDCQV